MLTYIIRRLLLMIPTLIGATMVVYFVMAFAPGGFSSQLDDGAQGMGDEARRIKQEMVNRYALDKPVPVQYLRWLNQVSPVGFKMTTDLEIDEADQRAVAELLADVDWIASERERTAKRDQILSIALYADREPEAVFELFQAASEEPLDAGPALFELIDAEPLGGETFWQELKATYEQDPTQAADQLLREVGYSAIGKSAVRYSAIKLWSPDLGKDKNNRNVGDLIGERLPITLLLNLITIPLIYLVSVISGVLAARWRGGWFDVGSGVFLLGLYSVPGIFAGVLMISFLANTQYLRLFPAAGLHDLQADSWPFLPFHNGTGWHRGWLLDHLWHLVLPVACLTYGGFAFMSKVMRSSTLEAISADYVRTARAKGVAEQQVLFRHVFRNALLPLITMAAAILPSLFVGSFVVEYIFSIQGMGLLMIEAAKNKEVNIVMAVTLVGSALMLFSLLLQDILYAVADPRVAYD